MKLILLTVLALALPLLAHADDKPYGMGGCGLGSVLMGKDGNAVLTMTTNETGTQTFGITSGTSNCVDSGVVKKKKQARAFIELNQHQLANDISKGGGESVSALSHLYNCTDDAAFSKALQKHYQTIYPTPATSADHVEQSIWSVLRVEMQGACLG